MTPFTVTKITNLKPNGELKDEEAIGIAFSDHVVTITQTDEAKGLQQTGLVPRIGVLWEKGRAISYEVPEELAWLEFDLHDLEEDEEDDDEEIEDPN